MAEYGRNELRPYAGCDAVGARFIAPVFKFNMDLAISNARVFIPIAPDVISIAPRVSRPIPIGVLRIAAINITKSDVIIHAIARWNTGAMNCAPTGDRRVVTISTCLPALMAQFTYPNL